ncbi:alanyl-tRNA editing protein [Ideonella sp. DXS29W]|uniref:Alanine--tRNA ligase n=1 Tax=Ideonella lacteola TaxID=2984193 RepID=A0ABU9BRD9_9BURK
MPPTIELFRDDADLNACDAIVTAVDGLAVQLDRTVFYPQGGGQAGDAGVLLTAEGRALRVIDTRKGAEPGQILHLLADATEAATLAAGQTVSARIDVARREAHRRFHTSTHLLCALVPHPVDGCSITAAYARLDFHMTEPLDKEELTAGLARLVAESHPVTTRWVTDADLDANPQWVRSMRVQPPRGNGLVRLVDVQGVDMQPCGGTHVSNTADIGAVVVTKIEKKSANTRRVVLGFGS